MNNTILGIAIALLPLYIRLANIDTNRPSKDLLFLTILSLLMVITAPPTRYLRPYFKQVMAVLILLTVFNVERVFSPNVISQMVYLFFGLSFFVSYYESFRYETVQDIFDGMIVGALIQAVLGMGGYFGHEWYFQGLAWMKPNIYYSVAMERWTIDPSAAISWKSSGAGLPNTVGSLGNNNLLACYLCLTIPAFLSRKKIQWLALIPIAALIISQSFMGIGSFLAGVVYYVNIKRKIMTSKLLYLGAITGMLLLPLLPLHIDSGRFRVWGRLLREASLSHWIIGRGPGWFADQMMAVDADNYLAQEHNSFLTLFNAFGLVGFLLLAPIFLRYIRVEHREPIAPTILFIAFCNSYGHFNLYQSTAMIIILPVLAICIAKSELIIRQKNKT